MPKTALFERSCRELSLDVSVGVHILLIVEQSSLKSQSRLCVCQDSDTYGNTLVVLASRAGRIFAVQKLLR